MSADTPQPDNNLAGMGTPPPTGVALLVQQAGELAEKVRTDAEDVRQLVETVRERHGALADDAQRAIQMARDALDALSK